jgi:hypothetical protein
MVNDGLLAPEPGDGVGRLRQRPQLAVVVTDVDGDLLELSRTQQQVVQDPPTGVLRTGDAHQDGERRRQVDRPHADHRVTVTDARTGGHEDGVHVDVVGEVDQIREITVLAEELAERDPLRMGVEKESLRAFGEDRLGHTLMPRCAKAPVEMPESASFRRERTMV